MVMTSDRIAVPVAMSALFFSGSLRPSIALPHGSRVISLGIQTGAP